MRLKSILCAAFAMSVVASPATRQMVGSHIKKRSDQTHQLATNDSNRVLLAVDDLTACYADAYTARSRSILALPFASEEQAEKANEYIGASNNCLQAGYLIGADAMLYVASLAENIAEQDLGLRRDSSVAQVNGAKFSGANVEAVAPAEGFGICVVQNDPQGVVDTLATVPGSSSEVEMMNSIGEALGRCVPSDMEISLTPRKLRAAISIGLYRTAQAVSDRGDK